MTSHFKALLIASFLLICSANAQLNIGFRLPGKSFIQHEGIPVELTLINNSGTQLIFGENSLSSGNIEFLIADRNNRLVKPFKADFNPAKGLILGSGETKKLKFLLNKYYKLYKSGNYSITARVRHHKLGRHYYTTKRAQKLSIERGYLEPGNKKSFGVADPRDTDKVITRHYEILSYSKEKGDIYVLKIYDKKWIYAVHRIAPRVSGIPFKHDVDSFSNIHILAQMKPKVFKHAIYTNDGKLKQEKFYRASFESTPQLYRDPTIGKIAIINATIAVPGLDYQEGEFD